MTKTKVKIIEHDEYDKLEVLVNEFIEKIPGPDLIDIKYATTSVFGEAEKAYTANTTMRVRQDVIYYSAMVIYDEDEA
jgi:hypothetical protein